MQSRVRIQKWEFGNHQPTKPVSVTKEADGDLFKNNSTTRIGAEVERGC